MAKNGKIHAFLGRNRRGGRWRLSPGTSVVAVLGSCRMDLRQVHLEDSESRINARIFLGSVTIIVPPGVEVRPSGVSFLGSSVVEVPPFDDCAEVALIEIEWSSAFGRLRVIDGIGASDKPEDELLGRLETVDALLPVAVHSSSSAAASEAPSASGAGDEELDDTAPTQPESATAGTGVEDLEDDDGESISAKAPADA